MAMKLLGIPYPRLEGFHLFENWLDLSLKEKMKSILGTARRIVQRNYFRPLDYSRYER
jgi:coenzyme F420 hydrogenase subunit beta